MKRITAHDVWLLLLLSYLIIIIIMYISHALINTLSARMIHINLNTIIILLIILTTINSHMYCDVCMYANTLNLAMSHTDLWPHHGIIIKQVVYSVRKSLLKQELQLLVSQFLLVFSLWSRQLAPLSTVIDQYCWHNHAEFEASCL